MRKIDTYAYCAVRKSNGREWLNTLECAATKPQVEKELATNAAIVPQWVAEHPCVAIALVEIHVVGREPCTA